MTGHFMGEAMPLDALMLMGKGYAEAILLAFESHIVTLDVENRQAILDCQDTALLRRLLTNAFIAGSASEVLAELEKRN